MLQSRAPSACLICRGWSTQAKNIEQKLSMLLAAIKAPRPQGSCNHPSATALPADLGATVSRWNGTKGGQVRLRSVPSQTFQL